MFATRRREQDGGSTADRSSVQLRLSLIIFEQRKDWAMGLGSGIGMVKERHAKPVAWEKTFGRYK